MNELQVFQNSKFGDLEILTIEGKEWFPAIKVAEILGYTNPRKAIRDHTKERGVTIRSVIDSLGRNQDKKFIDEGNLYRLITRSKLPQADEFEEWVFEECDKVIVHSSNKRGSVHTLTNSGVEVDLANQEGLIDICWHSLYKLVQVGHYV